MLFNEKSIKNEIFKDDKVVIFSEVLDGIDIRQKIEVLIQNPNYSKVKYLLVSTLNLDLSEIENCNSIDEAFDKFPDNAVSMFTIEINGNYINFADDDNNDKIIENPNSNDDETFDEFPPPGYSVSLFSMEGKFIYQSFANDDIDAIIGVGSRRIQIYDLYTNKKFRNKGLTSKFLSLVPWLFGNDDYMIFLKAAASCREYPDCPTDEEIQDIVENLVKFYEKCGYVDVNHPISDFECSRMMIYVSSESDRRLVKYLLKLYEDKENQYRKEIKKC